MALTPGIAEAQRAPAPAAQPARSSSQFALRREEAGGSDAGVARSRARAGDCAGALPAFDSAVRATIEPTLRRDRGLCHEKLGNVFPAIDDYRAYVTGRPDAPDADQIRDRLARLEEQAGVGRASAQSVKDREDTSGTAGGASFSLGTTSSSGGSSRKSARSDKPLGPRSGETGKSYDYYAAEEKLADAAESSPLRYGTGWALGPFLQLPRYFFSNGETSDAGAAIGATIRYAWAPALTFITEVGYVSYGTTGEASKLAGPLVFVGFEYKIPLNAWASDQLFFGVGPGFERYQFGQTKIARNVVNVRGRFGYRHVFGPSFGLELAVDGGPGIAFASGTPAGSTSENNALTVLSGTVAFVIGF